MLDLLRYAGSHLRTVYTQMSKISIPRVHHTQLVQVVIFTPTKTVTIMTAPIAMVYKLSQT